MENNSVTILQKLLAEDSSNTGILNWLFLYLLDFISHFKSLDKLAFINRIKNYNYFSNLSPSAYRNEICLWYYVNTGHRVNPENPHTYNEKVQWVKLHGITPLMEKLSDKSLAREWVKSKIGEKYLVPLIGIWDSFEEIDFSKFPKQFVIKATHGCEMNVIVDNQHPFDYEKTKTKITQWLNTNFAYCNSFELQYKNLRPRIIAEEYMENADHDIYDYKIWCFNGKAQYIQFYADRKTRVKMAFFDRNWNKQAFAYYPMYEKTVKRPDNLDEMLRLAEVLAADFPHVRVDFYRLNGGTIRFGEMTFTSASGRAHWNPPEADEMIGKLFVLPPRQDWL